MHSLEDADSRVEDEDGDEIPNITYDPCIAGTHSVSLMLVKSYTFVENQ